MVVIVDIVELQIHPEGSSSGNKTLHALQNRPSLETLNTSSQLHQPFSPPGDERELEDSQRLYEVEKRERESY